MKNIIKIKVKIMKKRLKIIVIKFLIMKEKYKVDKLNNRNKEIYENENEELKLLKIIMKMN